MDECLQILKLAWSGEPFDYTGQHYQATDLQFRPTPVHGTHIPIWPVGAWPHDRSLSRAARFDGIVVSDMSGATPEDEPPVPETIANVVTWMTDHRAAQGPFDIIIEGTTSSSDQEQNEHVLRSRIAAGATWFMESHWGGSVSFASLMDRIKHGPPHVQ